MKRSEINHALREAKEAFAQAGWALTLNPGWYVTDLGLGRFAHTGLVLVNHAEEPECCEKRMFSRFQQITLMPTHGCKKEGIICRRGLLTRELWAGPREKTALATPIELHRNGSPFTARSAEPFPIAAGERVTLVPGRYDAIWAESEEGCVIGEVSTANDDAHDNFFTDPENGRFPHIEEDEPPLCPLIGDH